MEMHKIMQYDTGTQRKIKQTKESRHMDSLFFWKNSHKINLKWINYDEKQS
jgi:hypothetical protein